MKVIFFGSSNISVPFLEELYKSNHSVELAVTTIDRPAGRGRKITPNIIKNKATELGIEYILVDKIDDIFFDRFKSMEFNVVVVVCFGKIFPEKIFSIKPVKWLNVHPSLLPAHRGPAPIVSTLLNGDKMGGVSIIEVVPEIDAGDIYAQVKFGIEESDNRDSLERKSVFFGSSILIKVLDLLENGNIKPYPQGEDDISYSYKIKKDDLKIKWENSTEKIINKIRAFSSNPGAYCFWRGLRIKILEAAAIEAAALKLFLTELNKLKNKENGLILKAGKDSDILVKCNGNELLRVKTLQLQGKKAMSAVDFVNGYRLKPGDKFE